MCHLQYLQSSNKLQHHSAQVAWAMHGQAQRRGLPKESFIKNARHIMSYCHTLPCNAMLISTTYFFLETLGADKHHRTWIGPCSYCGVAHCYKSWWHFHTLQQATSCLANIPQHPGNVCTHPHCKDLLDLVGLSYFETLKCSANLCGAFPAGRASKCEGMRNIGKAAKPW